MNVQSISIDRTVSLALPGWFVWMLVMALSFICPPLARGATFNCASGDTACLIDAVSQSNVTVENDEIILEPGTYRLTEIYETHPRYGASGLPVIKGELLIQSSNAMIIRWSLAAFRIMTVDEEGSLTIEGLTISGGIANEDGGGEPLGGGIGSWGEPTIIRNSIISGNHAYEGGGIWAECGLVVSGSTIRGNNSLDYGGGLSHFCGPDGEAVIFNSTIDMNTARSAGGVYTTGISVLIDSTVSSNFATYGSGGIDSYAMRAVNATITENIGGIAGGFLHSGCNAFICDSVIVNTILAHNHGSEFDDCASSGEGTLVSEGHNIIGKPEGCDVALQPSDIVGDPGLGSFTDNLAPGNGHYPLRSDSQAVDAGDDNRCSPIDQIGQTRYDGNGDGNVVCDIGAVEYPGEYELVAIDFKPGNDRNVINPRAQGRFWLAILSDANFDALATDPSTVELGPGSAAPDRYYARDVNRDRVIDLMLRFRTPAVGIACGDSSLDINGQTYAGDEIRGMDTIQTTGCKARGKTNSGR